MGKTKCISCKQEFEENKENKKIKVTLSNPGDVLCEGKVITCPNCNEHFVNEEDILDIAESFDIAHAEKYNKLEKEVSV